MRKDQVRELRKIAQLKPFYKFIGFYITGSSKTFTSIKEARAYAKKMKWTITNPLKLKEEKYEN